MDNKQVVKLMFDFMQGPIWISNFETAISALDDRETKMKYLKKIAVINIKKPNGQKSFSDSDLKKYTANQEIKLWLDYIQALLNFVQLVLSGQVQENVTVSV